MIEVEAAIAILEPPMNRAIAYLTLLRLLHEGDLTAEQAQIVLDDTGLAAAGYTLPERQVDA